METLLNLTPQPLALHGPGGITHLEPAGPAPRLERRRVSYDPLCGLPVVRTTFMEPTGLPEYRDDVILVVSAEVAEHPALAGREDLAYPGEAIRDETGRIIGAQGLCAGAGLAERLKRIP